MQAPVQHAAQDPGDTLFVHIYNGPQPNTFQYYEDDGTSYDFEKGSYYQREIRYNPVTKEVAFGKKSGSLPSKFSYIKVVLHGVSSSNATVNGTRVNTTTESFNMLNPISKFDPIGREGDKDYSNNSVIGFSNSDESIAVRY
jgi:alpha-glucosidase